MGVMPRGGGAHWDRRDEVEDAALFSGRHVANAFVDLAEGLAEADEMWAEHDVEAHRVGLAHRIVLLYLKCMNMYLQRAFVVLWETSGRFVVLRETSGRCPARRYQL